MLWSQVLPLALMPLAALAKKATTTPEGVVSIPLQRIRNETAYGAELLLGTPPQKVLMLVDTGSPTYGANTPNNPICQRGLCEPYGTYDNTTSSTTKWIDGDFNNILINRGYGSDVNDTVSIGDQTWENLKFGQIEGYGASFPITAPLPTVLGLGASCFTKKCDGYPTLLQQLYERGVVSRRVVSIYLGPEAKGATGEILLGGYDKAKRQGTVWKRDVMDPTDVNANGQPNRAPVQSISYIASNGTETTQDFGSDYYTLWDTGSSSWYIPQNIFDQVSKKFGFTAGEYDSSPFDVDCKHLNDTREALEVNFGEGASIKIPLNRLVTQLSPTHCITTVAPNANETLIGDIFFRNAYITFDYDNLTVEFSAVKYTDERDIVKA